MEAVRVKCNAPKEVFYGICGPEAIRVWLPSLHRHLPWIEYNIKFWGGGGWRTGYSVAVEQITIINILSYAI